MEKKLKSNLLLSDYFITEFLAITDLGAKRKKYISQNLPNMGEAERKSLIQFLEEIYILDAEKKEAVKKIVESI